METVQAEEEKGTKYKPMNRPICTYTAIHMMQEFLT